MSVGVSLYPDHGTTVSVLMKKADKAMYQAKLEGRNNYMYLPSYDKGDYGRLLFTSEFDRALSNGQFFLEYQPIFDLNSGEICSLEALVRWNHPEKGRLAPNDFIHIAEENGFIIPLGEWVIREACFQNKAWEKRGLKSIRVAVNVSANQFCHNSFLCNINQILKDTELDPKFLEIEITENILIRDEKAILSALEVLKNIGIYISIDDFGTGYSSLNYLKHFTVDALKIDRSFIKDLPKDKGLTQMIISLARKLKLKVKAEGVETHAQHNFLINNGCHEAQGFLYSRPMPASDIEQLLKD